MTKAEFKRRWESNENGDGLTFDDIAECAQMWGLYGTPRTRPMDRVRYDVLKAARCIDAEEYNPDAGEMAEEKSE